MNTTIITTHTNDTGAIYFSKKSDNGEIIYSFNPDFSDHWTQDDQDAMESGNAPAKY